MSPKTDPTILKIYYTILEYKGVEYVLFKAKPSKTTKIQFAVRLPELQMLNTHFCPGTKKAVLLTLCQAPAGFLLSILPVAPIHFSLGFCWLQAL